MEKNIRIILADDKEKYRSLLSELLQPFQITVIGEACNGRELLSLLRKKRPDVVLLDLGMPVMDGNEAFDVICKQFPGLKVIIISSYAESVLMEDYIARGARGYLSKDTLEPDLLAEAISRVDSGGVFMHMEPATVNKFTARQKEIMPLIFEGLTNDEIAGEIHITRRAVEKQRNKLYLRSGAERAIDFYKYAFARGLQYLGRYRAAKDARTMH